MKAKRVRKNIIINFTIMYYNYGVSVSENVNVHVSKNVNANVIATASVTVYQ